MSGSALRPLGAVGAPDTWEASEPNHVSDKFRAECRRVLAAALVPHNARNNDNAGQGQADSDPDGSVRAQTFENQTYELSGGDWRKYSSILQEKITQAISDARNTASQPLIHGQDQADSLSTPTISSSAMAEALAGFPNVPDWQSQSFVSSKDLDSIREHVLSSTVHELPAEGTIAREDVEARSLEMLAAVNEIKRMLCDMQAAYGSGQKKQAEFQAHFTKPDHVARRLEMTTQVLERQVDLFSSNQCLLPLDDLQRLAAVVGPLYMQIERAAVTKWGQEMAATKLPVVSFAAWIVQILDLMRGSMVDEATVLPAGSIRYVTKPMAAAQHIGAVLLPSAQGLGRSPASAPIVEPVATAPTPAIAPAVEPRAPTPSHATTPSSQQQMLSRQQLHQQPSPAIAPVRLVRGDATTATIRWHTFPPPPALPPIVSNEQRDRIHAQVNAKPAIPLPAAGSSEYQELMKSLQDLNIALSEIKRIHVLLRNEYGDGQVAEDEFGREVFTAGNAGYKYMLATNLLNRQHELKQTSQCILRAPDLERIGINLAQVYLQIELAAVAKWGREGAADKLPKIMVAEWIVHLIDAVRGEVADRNKLVAGDKRYVNMSWESVESMAEVVAKTCPSLVPLLNQLKSAAGAGKPKVTGPKSGEPKPAPVISLPAVVSPTPAHDWPKPVDFSKPVDSPKPADASSTGAVRESSTLPAETTPPTSTPSDASLPTAQPVQADQPSAPTPPPPSRQRPSRRQRGPKPDLASLPARLIRARALFGGSRIEVFDAHDQRVAWNGGAFGSGAWSRSEPTWRERTEKLVGEQSDELEHVEDVARERKQERAARKTRGRNGVYAEVGEEHDEEEQEGDSGLLNATAVTRMNAQALASQVDMSTITEPMVLMPDECIFLASHNRLAIRFDDEPEPVASAPHLWHKLGYGDSPSKQVRYAAYATFRQAGWAVRCGAKFGVDFLLYAKGPQFGHSKYAVVVVPTASGANKHHGVALPLPDGGASWLKTAQRVVGQAKKKLLLCYVTLPTPAQTRKLEPSSRTHMPLASLVTFPVYLVSFIWYAIVLSLFAPGTPEQTADGSAMRKAQAGTIPKGSLPALPAGSDAVVPQIKGAEVRCVEVGRWNPGKNRE